MVYGTPYNSLGMRRCKFFCQTIQPKSSSRPNQYLQVSPKSEHRNTINTRYMCTFEENTSSTIKFGVWKRRWRVFLGSKGVQEEFSWSFKGALWRTKVYDAAKCIVLRLWWCNLGLYSGNDGMRFTREWRLNLTRDWIYVWGMK